MVKGRAADKDQNVTGPCCPVAELCPTLCDPMNGSTPASLSFTISRSLLKLMSIESMMPSNHLILCHPLCLLPSIFPSIRVLSRESALHIRWPKYWSFGFSIVHPVNIQGLVSDGPPDELLWFSGLSNCDPLPGMKNASSTC